MNHVPSSFRLLLPLLLLRLPAGLGPLMQRFSVLFSEANCLIVITHTHTHTHTNTQKHTHTHSHPTTHTPPPQIQGPTVSKLCPALNPSEGSSYCLNETHTLIGSS